MSIVKELCVGRRYVNAQGEEKTQWIRIGAIHSAKSGKEYMTLDSHISLAGLPKARQDDGDTRIYVQMFDPKTEEVARPRGRAQPSGGASAFADMDDDVAF